MSFSHKASQPIGEFLSDDYKKVDSMTQRAKSITMLKYNDQKDRLKLEQNIDKKMTAAEKNQKAHIKHQVSKTR